MKNDIIKFMFPFLALAGLSACGNQTSQKGPSANAPTTATAQAPEPELEPLPNDPKLIERVKAIRALSDEDLGKELNDAKNPDLEVIAETLRRGGPKWQQRLQSKLDDTRKDFAAQQAKKPKVSFPTDDELLYISAINRLQGAPDPVPVVIDGTATLEITWPEMPILKVSIVNRDPYKRVVDWSEGNYRHGRRESFSFDVHDAAGHEMPIVTRDAFDANGGGIISFISLKENERWTSTLPLSSYVKVLRPGAYTVRAAYAYGRAFGSIQDKTASFSCISGPIKLTVKPREIVLRHDDRAKVTAIFDRLEATSPVKVLAGTYNRDEDNNFIGANTPAGEILQMGWTAVPALLDKLDDNQLSQEKRAWLFSLLFSITGIHDPCDQYSSDVLGSYDRVSRGWTALSKLPDGATIGGVGLSGTSSASGGKINPESQAKLAAKWRATKAFIKIL